MWPLLAVGSSFFAGITAILAKCGIRRTDSDVATAVRTVVVLLFSWGIVFLTGAAEGIGEIGGRTFLFLILSGLATGASWLCYFRALQNGPVNRVAPIDKSSTVLTIFLALIFLKEGLTLEKAVCAVLIGGGTLLMAAPGAGTKGAADDIGEVVKSAAAGTGPWLVYAILSAVFASLTAILSKIGIEGLDSNLGTAIRTTVVLIMAWMMVGVAGKFRKVMEIERRELFFIVLSGFATGVSWLCYYRALKEGPASVVVPIDRLSLLVTVAFSWIVFGERLTGRSALGLTLIIAGTVILAFL